MIHIPDTPVWISSCDVGCITGKTENVFTYDYSGKKQEIILAEYPDNPQNVSMDINDISGDGRDEILVCRGGKSRSYSIWAYDDREGIPKDIKSAVPKCSKKKMEEIEQEIEILKPIFQKLKEAADDDKKLPFESGDFGLTKEEESILVQEGYLYNDMGKCYLPEIIRHALDFTYSKGARPKVLALIAKKKV